MRRKIQIRKRYFFAVEGEGEQGFVKWLTDESSASIHPIVNNLGGSSNKAMLDKAIRLAKKEVTTHGKVEYKILLIDGDKLGQEGNYNESELREKCTKEKFELIIQKPNLEGILLRLFEKHHRKKITDLNELNRELSKIWPEYKKHANAVTIRNKFKIDDFIRLARVDDEIKKLAKIFDIKI